MKQPEVPKQPAFRQADVIASFAPSQDLSEWWKSTQLDLKRKELSKSILNLCQSFMNENKIDGVGINCATIYNNTDELKSANKSPLPPITFVIDLDKQEPI